MAGSFITTRSRKERVVLNQTIVKVKKLTKMYGSKAVVHDISFNVFKGEVFGILGPNGAGKTTTLEMMETLRPISSGTIIIDGLDVQRQPDAVKRIIGVQPQTAAFNDKQKIKEIITLFGAAYGERVDPLALLEQVNLVDKANAYAEQLSGGQRQRLSIATALVHQPKVFFMDEPTTGLDPQARLNLWELVTDITNRGVTVILTTHYMEEAQSLCDRVAVMDNGRIIAIDKPEVLIRQLIQRGFKKKQPIERANLEDVFIDLTGKALRD